MGINIAAIMGRLTASPELKSTSNGTPVVNICIAVDRRYQPNNDEKLADFIDCSAFGKTAEFISRNFTKGQMIAVEGSIQTHNYSTSEGNNRKITDVLIDHASFAGYKNSNNNNDDYEVIE